MRAKQLLFVFIATAMLTGTGFAIDSPKAQVIAAWDDTGDFGPQTPNTKTCGLQEAIDYCVANARDLYVKGGWGGRKPVYNISVPIHIPATQDFRIDGGVYVLNWSGPADDPAQDLMVIDSAMNAEYHFGIFVYGGAGAAMRVRPENPVPIDGFPVMIETEIKSQGLADPSPFTPGERKAGAGLVLDGAKAPITACRFDFIGGILNFKTCIEARGAFVQNQFECLHLHTNADKSTLFDLGPECAQNTLRLVIGVDQGAKDVSGVLVRGSNNKLQINTRGGFPLARDIVLENTARGNCIDLIHGSPEAFDPAAFITDAASTPTNRLTWLGGAKLSRITIPAGIYTHTQRLYPAMVHVLSGEVSKMNLLRSGVSLDITSPPPSGILLRVGDQLALECATPSELMVAPFSSE